MTFNSVAFLLFFVPLYWLYWRVADRFRWGLLLFASYLFMAIWEPSYAALLVSVTAITYVTGRLIVERARQRKLWLTLGLIFLFGILFTFKYFNFLSATIGGPLLSLLLPIGISFYTFTASGYLVDVFRGTKKVEKNFGLLALFLAFFPNVTAGPIERAKHLLPQFKAQKKFSYAQAVSGLQLFTYGLFKKVVIADNLGVIVDQVFNSLPEYKGLSLVLTMVFFTWQIYADFSGYIDMARGIARMLGIDLFENFNAPYLATSARDFWRRWNISLSTWFRDYLYIPLGGDRHGLLRTCLNVLIVFTLTGLWHGADWTFIFWGELFGVAIVAERLVGHYLPKLRFPHLVSVLYTYVLVSVSWVFFRAESFTDAFYILRASLSGARYFVSPSYIWATLSQLFNTNVLEMVITLGCLVTMVVLELILRGRPVTDILPKLPTPVRWSIYCTLLLLILFLRNATIPQFIYYQF